MRRIRATHGAGVHLPDERRLCPVDQRPEPGAEIGGAPFAEPAHFAYEAQQFGAAHGEAKGGAQHDLDPILVVRRPFERSIERLRELGRTAGDRGIEQGLLRREPVEDRLLGQPQLVAEVVERGRVESPGAERAQCRVENPLVSADRGGAGGHPRILDKVVYHLVDNLQQMTHAERAGGPT